MDFEVIQLVLKSSIGSGGGGGGGDGDGGSVAESGSHPHQAGSHPHHQAEEDSREHRLHEQRLADMFRAEVTSKCTDEAIVFIYISGVQFPFEVRGRGGGERGDFILPTPTFLLLAGS